MAAVAFRTHLVQANTPLKPGLLENAAHKTATTISNNRQHFKVCVIHLKPAGLSPRRAVKHLGSLSKNPKVPCVCFGGASGCKLPQ